MNKSNHTAPSTGTLPLLLTVAEAASLLRVTLKAAYAMVERDQMPGVVRFGTRLRIRSRDLLDFADQKPTPSSRRSGR